MQGLEGVPMPTASERDVLWHRSSVTNGDCVEVASREGHLLVRDSKAPDEAVLDFPWKDWRAFLRDIRRGDAPRAQGRAWGC
jgi:Domain of unknown function (DUF397)